MSVMVISGGAITAKTEAVAVERAALVDQGEQLASQIRTTTARGEYIRALIAHDQPAQDGLDAVLAARPEFISALATLRTALVNADGKIDTAVHRAAALATQETVRAETRDATTITNATATITALATKIDAEVKAWQVAQQSAGDGRLSTSSSSDGYARVRAALDRVGGGGVGLYESSSCAGGSAPACANSNGYIKYRADVGDWSESRINWAMAHELGHIYQFQVWGALNDSSAYYSLFDGDPEFLANCMALVRGYPGSVGCDGDQQIWASAIWVGSVR